MLRGPIFIFLAIISSATALAFPFCATAMLGDSTFTVVATSNGELFQLRDGAERIGRKLHPQVELKALSFRPWGPLRSLAVASLEPSPHTTSGAIAAITETGKLLVVKTSRLGAPMIEHEIAAEIKNLSLVNDRGGGLRLFAQDRRGIFSTRFDADAALIGEKVNAERFITWPTEMVPFDFFNALDADSVLTVAETGTFAEINRGKIARHGKLPAGWIRAATGYRWGRDLVIWFVDEQGNLYHYAVNSQKLTLAAPADPARAPFAWLTSAASRATNIFKEGWKEGFLSHRDTLGADPWSQRVIASAADGALYTPWAPGGPSVPSLHQPQIGYSTAVTVDSGLSGLVRAGQLAAIAFDGPNELKLREAKLAQCEVPSEIRPVLIGNWVRHRKFDRMLDLEPEISEALSPIETRGGQILLLSLLTQTTRENVLRLENLDDVYVAAEIHRLRRQLMGAEIIPGIIAGAAVASGLPSDKFALDFYRWNDRQDPAPLHEKISRYLEIVNPLWEW